MLAYTEANTHTVCRITDECWISGELLLMDIIDVLLLSVVQYDAVNNRINTHAGKLSVTLYIRIVNVLLV